MFIKVPFSHLCYKDLNIQNIQFQTILFPFMLCVQYIGGYFKPFPSRSKGMNEMLLCSGKFV